MRRKCHVRRAFAKKLNDAPLAIVDKRRSAHNTSEVMNLIGDVDGKVAVLVDDMIDTAGTITNAAKVRNLPITRFEWGKTVVSSVDPQIALGICGWLNVQVLHAEGAREVYACATHAVFSPPATERLSGGVFQEVIVTNTIPVASELQFPCLTVLSVRLCPLQSLRHCCLQTRRLRREAALCTPSSPRGGHSAGREPAWRDHLACLCVQLCPRNRTVKDYVSRTL